ncbi:peptidase [Marmoricola sp. Leaf446]|uniref:KPN_02809 family neutral zinc metallopeptidase n=1 Tax=Marmoricola sp. Leaf446 TaxID=1736379 RepID=UPI000701038A|nr:neutral zinc metallopeptidase [Marmoricola sp. Leaf446]KQT94593.1 peptidase [Marmoricola sp. Leaf446]
MRFNPKARIDQSQVEVRRGGGGGGFGGGGSRLPIPTGGKGGLGIGGIIVIVLFIVLSQCVGGGGGLGGGPGGGGTTSGAGDQQASNECRTGADANSSDACAIDLFTTSVQDYWDQAYPDQTGEAYQPIRTVRFEGSTQSGCGQASSEMGPFYCPNDQQVYLDTTFFDDMLRGQLGAQGGPFAIGYVIAHEYGHHVEDLQGDLGRIRTQQGAQSDAVRVELKADCLAGMWARSATRTQDQDGQTIISDLTQDDITRAIDAAEAVGDDRIQQRSGGRVDTDSFTHGSAAQRVKWFNIGLEQGSLEACDTFAARRL